MLLFAGFKVSSDNEQAIRLALGQSNYAVTGEEGPQYFASEYEDDAELRTDSSELAKRIQREGIVLLRNADEVLPLRKGAMVSVFGKGAVNPVYCGRRKRSASMKNCGISRREGDGTPFRGAWRRAWKSIPRRQ